MTAALGLSSCAAGPGGKTSNDGQTTLHAILLPAGRGYLAKNELAPQYEEQTGVKVNVQLNGRDAIYKKMATLFAAGD